MLYSSRTVLQERKLVEDGFQNHTVVSSVTVELNESLVTQSFILEA